MKKFFKQKFFYILNNYKKEQNLFFQLPNFGNRPQDVDKFINLSLSRLGLDYIDLYLIHMPFAFVYDELNNAPATNNDGSFKLDLDSDPVKVWKEMEKQVKLGRAKSIGVSNFNEAQINSILNSSEIKPCNLQVQADFLKRNIKFYVLYFFAG